MKLGIMQPYLFPYIGYFQLISAVDKFVIYDDVNFIKQGWINRNRILLNNAPHLFTVPVKNISSYTTINEVILDEKNFPKWKTKFTKTLENAYKKAPHYSEIKPLVIEVLETPVHTISELAAKSIITVSDYLDMATNFVTSSTTYKNKHLKAQERVLDIVKQEKATTYINVVGGGELYSKKVFAQHGFALKFISPTAIHYQQSTPNFVPHLSIIDILMFNTKEKIQELLNCYELI